jgi:hypothetical protein
MITTTMDGDYDDDRRRIAMATTIVTTTTTLDGDCDRRRQWRRCRTIRVREFYNDGMQKRKEIFFFYFMYFYFFILFVSSTDLAAWSFDHSCRELTEMEIKK